MRSIEFLDSEGFAMARIHVNLGMTAFARAERRIPSRNS